MSTLVALLLGLAAGESRAAEARWIEVSGAPSMGEAHSMLACVHLWYDYDPAGAERESRRALELNPSYDLAHAFYGWYLITQKRVEEGLAEGRRAVELSPLDPELRMVLGESLYYSHRYDEARVELLGSIRLSPGLDQAKPRLLVSQRFAGMGLPGAR